MFTNEQASRSVTFFGNEEQDKRSDVTRNYAGRSTAVFATNKCAFPTASRELSYTVFIKRTFVVRPLHRLFFALQSYRCRELSHTVFIKRTFVIFPRIKTAPEDSVSSGVFAIKAARRCCPAVSKILCSGDAVIDYAQSRLRSADITACDDIFAHNMHQLDVIRIGCLVYVPVGKRKIRL